MIRLLDGSHFVSLPFYCSVPKTEAGPGVLTMRRGYISVPVDIYMGFDNIAQLTVKTITRVLTVDNGIVS